jgi:DeoR family fructose operon transcriptional repressor
MDLSNSRRFAEQRLKEVYDYIRERKSVDVEELVLTFGVSGATIRSDLRELEKREHITRTHGGAIVRENGVIRDSNIDPEYKSRMKQNTGSKESIGNAVAKLIRDGESIMMDDGTTTLQVASCLPKDKRITIITNDINICFKTADMDNVEVISTGGIFRHRDLSYNGKIAEETAKKFFANKAIIGASGVSPEKGITSSEELKAELKKVMIENCAELIVVADSAKLGRVSLLPVCAMKQVHTLVTDADAQKALVEEFKKQGVRVIIAE